MKHPDPVSATSPTAAELAMREFVRAWGLFHATMRPHFARFGITGAQWGVLRALHRAEGAGLPALRLTDIGRVLLVQPPSVTSVVDRLERLELVERRPATSDHRAKEVVLTSKGRRLVARVLRRHPAQMRTVLGGLTDAEMRSFRALMTRAADHMANHLPSLRPEGASRHE